jgi:hypothetical protein
MALVSLFKSLSTFFEAPLKGIYRNIEMALSMTCMGVMMDYKDCWQK